MVILNEEENANIKSRRPKRENVGVGINRLDVCNKGGYYWDIPMHKNLLMKTKINSSDKAVSFLASATEIMFAHMSTKSGI